MQIKVPDALIPARVGSGRGSIQTIKAVEPIEVLGALIPRDQPAKCIDSGAIMAPGAGAGCIKAIEVLGALIENLIDAPRHLLSLRGSINAPATSIRSTSLPFDVHTLHATHLRLLRLQPRPQ